MTKVWIGLDIVSLELDLEVGPTSSSLRWCGPGRHMSVHHLSSVLLMSGAYLRTEGIRIGGIGRIDGTGERGEIGGVDTLSSKKQEQLTNYIMNGPT